MFETKWISKEKIKEHIEKHVVNENNDYETELWEKEFKNYDILKYEYNFKKENSDLFHQYRKKPNKLLNESCNLKYIYRSGNHYSCNVKRHYDNLTTCTSLNFNRKNKLLIYSCFFKNNIVIDALVLLMANQLLEKSLNEEFFTFDEILWTNENNLKRAFMFTAFYSNNDTPKLENAKMLLYKYLELQLTYILSNKECCKLKEYIHYHYLIYYLSESNEILKREFNEFIYKFNKKINIDQSSAITIIQDKIKQINDMITSFKNELEGYIYEHALLELSLVSINKNLNDIKSDIALEFIKRGLLGEQLRKMAITKI